MKAKILIQFPTRERPNKFLTVARKYIDFLSDKENWIMNVSCDIDDLTMNNPLMIDKVYDLAPEGKIFLNFNENGNKHIACNADISSFEFDICLLASDDMIPKEPGYDDTIRHYFGLYFPYFDGVVHFNDGHQGERLNTCPIVGRKYLERSGIIYEESYIGLWADREFDAISRILGKWQYINQVIIRHEHYSLKEGVERDDLYLKNDSFEPQDRANFQLRQARNFYLK
ncbi:MAG TPA: hypothetical protein ENH82_03405 [bacterium]|nr:hypothetical protein [bacterium]